MVWKELWGSVERKPPSVCGAQLCDWPRGQRRQTSLAPRLPCGVPDAVSAERDLQRGDGSLGTAKWEGLGELAGISKALVPDVTS